MIPVNGCRVEIFDQIPPLEALIEPWTELWSCARFATPFQHPAWILAFYRELAIQEPRILAAWQGPRLEVLVPFYLWRTADGPATLILAGNGVSDYLDALVRPGAEPCATEAIRVFMARSGSEWTTADFRDLDPQASLCLLPWPGAVSDTKSQEEGCPRLALRPRRLDDALAMASKRLRRDLERAERKLAGDEGRFEISGADPDTLTADYEELVELHTARWQTAGEPGIFSTDYHRRFFKAAFAGLACAGILRLFVVRWNGEPVAATGGFLHHGHYYHFIAGYDPRWSHLSLGSFAVYVALRAAVNEGAVCFDFLRGKEAYKYRWGARDHQTYRRRLRVTGNW